MRHTARLLPLMLPTLLPACSSDPAPSGGVDAALSASDVSVGRPSTDARPASAADVGVATAEPRPSMSMPGANPCMGVTTLGRCVSPQQAQYCAIATGRGDEQLVTQDCEAGEACMMSDEGFRCVRTGDCVANESSCGDANTLRTCMNGMWQSETCAAGCVTGGAGALCAVMAETTMRSGRFRYQARAVNQDFSAWGDPSWVAEEGFVVALQRGNDIVSGVRVRSDGRFDIAVPTAPTAEDRLVVLAVLFQGGSAVLAAGNPGFAASTTARMESQIPSERRAWSWSWDLAMMPTEGALDLSLTTAQGSGAAEAFAWMRATYERARSTHGRAGKSVIGWVGIGTSWACGACYNSIESSINRMRFDSQVWLDGSAASEGYWSSAVTVHEMGHWWMDSYSRDPGEGGEHTVGVATFPGQAWSEGWATFVAADVRNDSLYVDNQEGILWLDLDQRRTRQPGQSERSMVLPTADNQDGVMQFLDENWVSSALWRLRGTDSTPIYTALASERMRRAPFGRCYNRHQWSGVGVNATNICDTGESVPFFGDFLDALSCAMTDRERLSAAISPYPFDPESARCAAATQPGENCSAFGYDACRAEHLRAPMTLAVEQIARDASSARVRVTLAQRGALPGPYAIDLALPQGVRRTNGPARVVVPTLPRGARWSTELALAIDAPPREDLTVHAVVQRADLGWHGVARYGFGRPAAQPPPVGRARGTVRLRGVDLGPSVPVLERPALQLGRSASREARSGG